MKHDLKSLGDSEIEIMNIIWDKHKASVAEVHDEILTYRKVAYTTVMTIMKNLANKGYLKFEKEGMAYIYEPVREEKEVKGFLLKDMMSKVFKGSPGELVQALVEGQKLSEKEKMEIEEVISKLRTKK